MKTKLLALFLAVAALAGAQTPRPSPANVASGTGGTCAGLGGVINGTCGNTSYNGAQTLPNGSVATTQAVGDASAKLATDAALALALQAINPATNVQVSTTAVLPNTPTYSNGTAGVGATLTAGSNTTLAAIDGYTVLLNDRILVQNQVTTANNGCYTLTQIGSGSLPWILTRCVDYNTPTNINYTGSMCTIQTGSTYAADTCFSLVALISTVGTSSITYSQQTAGSNAGQPGGGVQFTGNTTPGDAIKVGPGASGKKIVDAGVAFSSLTQTVGSGTIALTTSAVGSGACSSASTVTITGTAATDAVIVSPNADPTGVTGYAVSATGSLYIWVYPTTNTVNAKVCNNTSGSLTPSALTLNVRVSR
jgi:hypothetical protein